MCVTFVWLSRRKLRRSSCAKVKFLAEDSFPFTPPVNEVCVHMMRTFGVHAMFARAVRYNITEYLACGYVRCVYFVCLGLRTLFE